MTTEAIFNFTDTSLIGRVVGVDTTRVAIDVENSSLLTRIGIGNLLAIRGATEQEYLIAIVERVTRTIKPVLPSDETEESLNEDLEIGPADSLKAFLIGTYRTVDGSRKNTFKRGADSFPQIDRECFVVEGKNLQGFMGLLGSDFKDEEKLKLGKFIADGQVDAIASGDKFFQRHAAILGSTGSGKSWAVSLLLERAANLQHPNIIVFDMHGEYGPLCKEEAKLATRYKIAGPGDLAAPKDHCIFLPYWLLNRDEMLSMLLDRSDQNAPNQASRFTMHVRDLKEATLKKEAKQDIADTFTVDSPIPYPLDELKQLLNTDNTAKGIGQGNREIKGEWEGKLTRFISRLDIKTADRRYGFMFQPPPAAMQYGWLADKMAALLGPGIKVIDFSEVPSDVLPVVTGTFARLIYDVQFWLDPQNRTPITVLCDEAHLYLPVRDDADAVQRQALGVFERIAKEGRKYGLSIVVVSQRPSDISRTILSQCNNFLALRLTNESDQAVIKKLVPDSLSTITSILPLLETGEALMLGDAVLLPTRIKLDMPRVAPDSATKDFWTEWNSKSPDIDAIKASVENLRGQTRTQ